MRLVTPLLEKSPARMTKRHRAKEFTRVFSFSQDEEIPEDLKVHIVLDNAATHKTPEVHKWLVKHPRFIFHSRSHLAALGVNLVERWFADLATKWLHRGVHTSVDHLVESMNTQVKT